MNMKNGEKFGIFFLFIFIIICAHSIHLIKICDNSTACGEYFNSSNKYITPFICFRITDYVYKKKNNNIQTN